MPFNLINEQEVGLRFRAVCTDDNFKGPWRDDINDAFSDAASHRAKRGNEDHVINIVRQQTVSARFVGTND